ncbi:MAG: hypothetical protein P4N60_21765 [Verrucomicrobiae bacterium]|nr:hypothetical protein [Verrucomicrobiae bacterium]
MRTHIAILTFSTLLLLNGGCSTVIMSQGKHLDEVFAPTATRLSVQQEIGAPVSSQTYDKPTTLSEIPDISSLPRSQHPTGLTALAGGYEDYRYKGLVYDLGAHQADGMVVGMTFGLGELWAFPESLRYTAAEKNKEHFFRVWYSPSGRCVAYLWRPAEGQTKAAKP